MGDLTAACLMQRQGQPYPAPTGWHRAADLGASMTSRDERDEQDDAPRRTEDLMREAPPPSVLGDVDDAVTPDAEGELTPWSSPRQDEEEGDA
jgi:hypothetical protein